MSDKGWIGIDLDGTLAEYHGWPADGSIGKPIPAMVERVKGWIAEGKDVKIFTARVSPIGRPALDEQVRDDIAEQYLRIYDWCETHIGHILDVTYSKSFQMIALYDDRCIQVETNTGRLIEDPPKPVTYPSLQEYLRGSNVQESPNQCKTCGTPNCTRHTSTISPYYD